MLRMLRTSPRGSDLSQTGSHRAGMPIPWLCPPPTPAAGHLNPSATLILHYLPSPPLTNWIVCPSHDCTHHLHLLPVTSTTPPPTPAASHLNHSTTSIPHYLPSPPLTNWTFHLPDPLLDAYRSSNTKGLQPFWKTLLFCTTASSKFFKFKKNSSLLIYPTSQVYIHSLQ